MQEIGLRLRELRNQLELNQVEFAKKIGVTNAHISAIEKGKTIPSASLIKLICKEFGVSEHWLVDGVGPEAEEMLLDAMEDSMITLTRRINAIRTTDNIPIRDRVIRLEELFVNIIEMGNAEDEDKVRYYDLCHKLFFHVHGYLDFQKGSFLFGQSHIFQYPDDLITNLKRDIQDFEDFFKK